MLQKKDAFNKETIISSRSKREYLEAIYLRYKRACQEKKGKDLRKAEATGKGKSLIPCLVNRKRGVESIPLLRILNTHHALRSRISSFVVAGETEFAV